MNGRTLINGLVISAVLWVAIVGLVLILAGCGQPVATQPTSRVAGANPTCIYRCYATVSSVDDNRSDNLAPVLSGSRTETTTETTTR